MGFWSDLTAWIVLAIHVFGGSAQYPFYDAARPGNWYDFGFLLGAGSPFLGAAGSRTRRTAARDAEHASDAPDWRRAA